MKYLDKHGHNESGSYMLEVNGYGLGIPPINLLVQPRPGTYKALVAFGLLANASAWRERGTCSGAMAPLRVCRDKGVEESSRE